MNYYVKRMTGFDIKFQIKNCREGINLNIRCNFDSLIELYGLDD